MWTAQIMAPNAASIPQYASDSPVGMLRLGILIHSSCMKGKDQVLLCNHPDSLQLSGGDWKPNGRGLPGQRLQITGDHCCMIEVEEPCCAVVQNVLSSCEHGNYTNFIAGYVCNNKSAGIELH